MCSATDWSQRVWADYEDLPRDVICYRGDVLVGVSDVLHLLQVHIHSRLELRYRGENLDKGNVHLGLILTSDFVSLGSPASVLRCGGDVLGPVGYPHGNDGHCSRSEGSNNRDERICRYRVPALDLWRSY